MTAHPPASEALAERFRPIFARIAARAAQREQERELAHDAVARLREAGFGALRVAPALGASVEQLFALLVELGEADSNLPQILRAHFGFIERLYAEVPAAQRERWLRLAGQGAIFGNATTERGEGALSRHRTALTRDGAGWRRMARSSTARAPCMPTGSWWWPAGPVTAIRSTPWFRPTHRASSGSTTGVASASA